jgi:hypothetical protein
MGNGRLLFFPSLFARRRTTAAVPAAPHDKPHVERSFTTMALTGIIKATYSDDDRDAAKAIAGIFNADRQMRIAAYGGNGDYTDEDILRLGEIITAYAPKGLPKAAQLKTPLRAQAVAAVAGELAGAAE